MFLFFFLLFSYIPHLSSEETGSDWHYLLYCLQSVPVHVRLRVVFSFDRPLLLWGWISAGSSAHSTPRRPYAPAVLTQRLSPVHGRPQGQWTIRCISQSEALLFACMFWIVLLILCVTAFRTQRSCAGTWEIQDRFCSPCTGTSIPTSVSTLTWTSKIKIYNLPKNSTIVIGPVYVLLMLCWYLCVWIRSGRYLLSGDTDGVVSVWDTLTAPPDGNEETLQPMLQYQAHTDCANGIRYK